MSKLLSVRQWKLFAASLVFALALVASAFVGVARIGATAKAEPAVPTLGTVGKTYVIGDDSLINAAGATQLENGKGWYAYDAYNNTYSYSSLETGWIYGISAQSSANERVCIKLKKDWIAESTGTAGVYTRFGDDEAAFRNGALFVPSDKYIKLDLNGFVLDRNLIKTNSAGGVVVYAENSNLEIADSNPQSLHRAANGATKYSYTKKTGGAISKPAQGADRGSLAIATESVELKGGIITGGYNSAAGGGIFARSATITISGGSIAGNISRGVAEVCTGAGIYANCGSTIVINGGYIVGNIASGSGGGIATENTVLHMRGGVVSDNTAGIGGGGIYMTNQSSTFIYDGKIENNIVVGTAGSIYGGGVYYNDAKALTVSGGSVSGNVVSNSPARAEDGSVYGGGIAIKASVFGRITIASAEIKDNIAYAASGSAFGGGLYATAADDPKQLSFAINGGSYVANSTTGNGGGIGLEKINCTISGGRISGNTASVGGGISIGEGCDNAVLNLGGNTEIVNNTANESGGMFISGDTMPVRIEGRVQISSNKAKTGAGGIGGIAGALYVKGAPVIFGNTVESSTSVPNDIDCAKLKGAAIEITGKLESGAKIGIGGAESAPSAAFTKGYGGHCVDERGFIIDASTYFTLNNVAHTVVINGSGEAYASSAVVEFRAGYGTGEIAKTTVSGTIGVVFDYTKGYVCKYEFNTGAVASITKDGESYAPKVSGELSDAGRYEIKLANSAAMYQVHIKAQAISPTLVAAALDLSGYYEYDGKPKTPKITSAGVKYDGIPMVENIDYTLTYTDNVLCGTGYAVLTFKGNYYGVHKIPFNIDVENGYYSVTWQYYNGAGWVELSSDALAFAATNERNRNYIIRAKLTVSASASTSTTAKYAYADGVTEHHDTTIAGAIDNSFKVVFKRENSAVDFYAVGEYELSLTGPNTGMPLGSNSATTVSIVAVDISSSVTVSIHENSVIYNGDNRRPDVNVMYGSLQLGERSDYTVRYTDGTNADVAILAGEATAIITFIGNYTGTCSVNYDITCAQNEWLDKPNIVRWEYGKFAPASSVIVARPKYILRTETVRCSILDRSGRIITVDGLELTDIAVRKAIDPVVGDCYKINDDRVVAVLNKLPVAEYNLSVWVVGNDCYTALEPVSAMFSILVAENSWVDEPAVGGWTYGNYDETINAPVAIPRYGTAQIVIRDENDQVYYDRNAGIDRLVSMPAGTYYMEVTVAGTSDYRELSRLRTFKVFEPYYNTEVIYAGMPWWGVLLTIFGVVVVIAGVLVVLHSKGVLHILSGKMVIAMRARADIDATIAAAKAERVAAAAAANLATTDEKEREKTMKKAAALEKKSHAPEEKAAALEKKAIAIKEKAKRQTGAPDETLEKKAAQTVEQAEMLKARARVMKTRADDMREQAGKKSKQQQHAAAQPQKQAEPEMAQAVAESEKREQNGAVQAQAEQSEIHNVNAGKKSGKKSAAKQKMQADSKETAEDNSAKEE